MDMKIRQDGAKNLKQHQAPTALPQEFSGGGGGGNSYPSQSSEPKSSPRMPEEYVEVKQQTQQNPQTQNQHPKQLASLHPSQAALVQSYGARNRGGRGGETFQGINSGSHSVSNNQYRKEAMDYYTLMGGKERLRRDQGLGCGTSVGYSNMDGHVPHQYRHAGPGSASSGMSHYQQHYNETAGSGGSSSSSSSSSGSGGTGAFSPSPQYSLSKKPFGQTAPGRQGPSRQALNYPSYQDLLQGQQQHRGYPVSGHRLLPQFAHYPSPGASSGSAGVYNIPPHRYYGNNNFECKGNSSINANTNSGPSNSLTKSSNMGQLDNVGHNYMSTNYPPYHSLTPLSHHKHPTHHQHNLEPGFDMSSKMHPSSSLNPPPTSGIPYVKHPPPSIASTNVSTNSSIPHFSSHDISKSSMHSQTQQAQINQNFSPISNPSPPSCSTSPSPLMGIPEASRSSTVTPAHPPSHPNLLTSSQNSHSQRLLQTVAQLSPTPNSNSSISSCGSSSGNVNAKGMNASPGSNHSVLIRKQMGVGSKGGVCEDNPSSLYPFSPLNKLNLDPGINSLNALTKQVANLPSTGQHMLLSDARLLRKKGKEGGYHMNVHQPSMSSSQQSSISNAFSIGSVTNSRIETGGNCCVDGEPTQAPESPKERRREGEEQFSGQKGRKTRQMSGASSESESIGHYFASQNQVNQTGRGGQGSLLEVKIGSSKKECQTLTSARVSLSNEFVHQTQSAFSKSPSSSSLPPSAEPSPNLLPSCPSATSVPTSSTPSPLIISSSHSTCVLDPNVNNVEHRNTVRGTEKEGKNCLAKKEEIKEEVKETWEEDWKNDTSRRDKEEERKSGDMKGNKEEPLEKHTDTSHTKMEDDKENLLKKLNLENHNKMFNTEEAQNIGGVGVIVSTRSEVTQSETFREPTQATSSAPEETYSSTSTSFLNGEGRSSVSNSTSNDGTKAPTKPDCGNSLLHNYPNSACPKSSHVYPDVPHSGGINSKNRGSMGSEGGIAKNVRYQGHHQPTLSYFPGKRKGMEPVRPGSRGNGKGQDTNPQLQQSFPSLLQEVLQGYHLGRCYERTEDSAHHTPNAYPQSQNKADYPGLVPTTGTNVDYRACTKLAAPGKIYDQKQGSKADVGQDSSLKPWSTNEVGARRADFGSSDKTGRTLNVQQSSESSQQQSLKHIHLAKYSLPQRKTSLNITTPPSAVQQLLLQDTEPIVSSGLSTDQTQLQTSSSSMLSSISSSERRSVICDVSPSCLTMPKREKDGEENRERNQPTGSSGASVIQQSLSSPPGIQHQGNSKEETKVIKIEEDSQAYKEEAFIQNAKPIFHSKHFPAKKNTVQHQNRSPYSSVDTNSDLHKSSIGWKGNVNVPSLHSQQDPQPNFSNINHLSSQSLRFQSNFQGLDGSNSHSAELAGHGLGSTAERTVNRNSHHPQLPSQHYHHLSSQFHMHNPQSTNKLQMYPHSLQHSQDMEDKPEWVVSKKNRSSKDILICSSPSSSGHQHQNAPGMRPQTGVPAIQAILPQQQLPHQDRYYDMKMWGLSQAGRDDGRTLQSYTCQSNQPSALTTGSVSQTSAPPADQKCLKTGPSKGVKEEIEKTFPMSPHNQSHGSCSNSNINLGTRQSHSQIKTGGSGDINPLMMRRRVRSFISPIPAKRQHQDLGQQSQQRGAPNLYSSPLHSFASRHQLDSNSSSPDTSYSRFPNNPCPTPIQNISSPSPSPSPGKTKILPPRKGRGLKLEAIVQKITPNLKKAADNNSTKSYINSTSSYSHAELHYNPDFQSDGDVSSIGHESCPPYLEESLSLDEIMSYRGVEETGPLLPNAYPYDPHQNTQIPKRGFTGNISSGAAGTLEPEANYGMGVSGSQLTEKDCTGENGREELRIPSDFTLLGPLPPPPPLPRPVEASPPPSSALSDIQHFPNTYQQLETRRGEYSVANLLQYKQETGVGLDDYSERDFFGTNQPHHKQKLGHCLIAKSPQVHLLNQQHTVHFSGIPSSMSSPSQLTESKHHDSMVPKGYFPSGKKRGRPVGSVNKQKRVSGQTPNVPLSVPVVAPIHTPEIIPYTTTTTLAPATSPGISIKDLPLVSPDASQIIKVDEESDDMQPKIEITSSRQQQRKEEDVSQDVVEKQKKRRRRGVGQVGKVELQSGTEAGREICGIFPGYRKSVFAPYIHVERMVEEIGAVCTIVNAEDEKSRGENDRGVGAKEKVGTSDILLSSTFSPQLTRIDRETEKTKEVAKTEKEYYTPTQHCVSGKAIPLSGYVLSGPAITESSNFSHLLCCLCKKWANYKNLGDLFGPYYPPEYVTRPLKNHPPIRHSLGTTRVSSTVFHSATDVSESLKHGIGLTEQPAFKSETDMDCAVSDTTNPASSSTKASSESREEVLSVSGTGGVAGDLASELPTASAGLEEAGPQNEPVEKPEKELSRHQLTEDGQQRPQHRKLTSHPRFKRWHKSSEDLAKTVSNNNKALLPFQPPPQLLNQNPSEASAQLAQLPQIPLDPEELWVHEGCIAWASGVFLVSGRLYGLQEVLDGARDACCSHCEAVGSTLGCYTKGCTLRYHYLCAIEAECLLNEDNFSLRCPKHKFPQNSRPEKGVYAEQSERG